MNNFALQPWRCALLRGAAWAAALGLASAGLFAQAQDDDDDDGPVVEEVVVTGSLIKKDNFDSASPLKVLDALDIEMEATPAMGEIIYNQTFNYGSDAFASHYSVTNPEGNRTGANLRGLGGGATLTLMNGKRVLDANLNNLIPQIAVRRIDILKDGASALYGSDAVAGVLNIVPKTGYQGAELGFQHQMDSRGDHSEQVANFIIGDLTDNGYFTLALEYRQRTALFQTERPNLLGNSFSSSGTGNPGTYNVPVRGEDGSIVGAARTPDPGCGVAASPGGNGLGMEIGNYRNNISGNLIGTTCRFQFGEFFNFVTPNKVLNSYVNFERRVTDNLTYNADLIYSRQRTRSRGSPTNPGGRVRDINLALGGVSGDHPGNPFTAFYDRNGNGEIDIDGMELLYAQDANGDGVPDRDADNNVILAADPFDSSMGIEFNEDVQIAALRLFGKLGNLPSNLDASGANLGYATYDINTYRMGHNFTYTFSDGWLGDRGWEATASVQLQQNVDIRFRKNGSYRAVLLGLQGELGPAPGVPDGHPDQYRYYNPFSTSALNCKYRNCTDPGAATNPNLGDYPNTQYVADAIDINALRLLKTSLTSYDLVATGDLADGWAGTIAAAVGVERRSVRLKWDARSDENQCNNWYDACSFDYTAQDIIESAFAEVAVPFVSSDQYGEGEIQLAGRYTSYEGVGSTFDPKIAVLYQPLDWVSLRASFSTAFRAPSISQRFAPQFSFLQSTNDPFFGDFEGTYRTNIGGGDPTLQPEEADVYNIGFSLALLDGNLNVGMDYANYYFTDRITFLRGPRVVETDLKNFLERFPQAGCTGASASACPPGSVNRDDAVNWVENFQDPNIVRGGPPSYSIVSVRGKYVNADVMDQTSVDAYANYTWATDSFGTLRFDLQATQILEYIYDFGGGNTGDAVGLQNLGIDVIPTLPEYRVIGSVNWNQDRHNALLRGRWNSAIDANWTAVDIEGVTYVDLTYSYRFDGLLGGSTTMAEVGARNLFDAYPDPLSGAFGANIELAIHDPRGRMVFARLRHEF